MLRSAFLPCPRAREARRPSGCLPRPTRRSRSPQRRRCSRGARSRAAGRQREVWRRRVIADIHRNLAGIGEDPAVRREALARHRVRLAPAHSRVTVIWLRVSVPVLSVHTTVQPPSVSTAASRLTSALRFAIRCTPSASETLTAVGSPSGMAETAAATENNSISTSDSPRSTPSPKMTVAATTDRMPSRVDRTARRCCRGVSWRSALRTSFAISPTTVPMPMAVTMAVARRQRRESTRRPS